MSTQDLRPIEPRKTTPAASSAWLGGVALIFVLAVRAIDPAQPIVENYVGRQIPTAMAARNLERGSGFLYPQLDTAPFPNYFVVEPPIYQTLVIGLERLTGVSLVAAGRLVSALAWGLAAVGLFVLVRGREGSGVAAGYAALALAVFPIGIRYGRAFQPDALALGLVMAGFACWNQGLAGNQAVRGRWRAFLAAGWCLLAAGFAARVILAYLLIPILLASRPLRLAKLLALGATVLPAVLWYGWALGLVGRAGGSRASADNQAVWLGTAGLGALLQPGMARFVARVLCVRAFTPIGTVLGVWGLVCGARSRDRLWLVWAGSTLAAMALLSAKLHHEYYWLPLAPAMAVGVGRALASIGQARPWLGALPALVLMGLALVQARSTFETPREWRSIVEAGRAVQTVVPKGALVVAPEALLFQADRRGCRLEWTGPAARRAAGEWGQAAELESPIDLVDFYRARGALYFADLGDAGLDPRRKDLHDAVRRRYKVKMDIPSIFIAELATAGSTR